MRLSSYPQIFNIVLLNNQFFSTRKNKDKILDLVKICCAGVWPESPDGGGHAVWRGPPDEGTHALSSPGQTERTVVLFVTAGGTLPGPGLEDTGSPPATELVTGGSPTCGSTAAWARPQARAP